MPASGRDSLLRLDTISVVARIVSPWNTGLGNFTSVMPRLPIVVPIVVSETEMPIISPSVKMLLTSGLPHSVVRCELMVDVQRLRIVREAGEQRVVHLGHGAADGVLDHAADLELVEVKALHSQLLCV